MSKLDDVVTTVNRNFKPIVKLQLQVCRYCEKEFVSSLIDLGKSRTLQYHPHCPASRPSPSVSGSKELEAFNKHLDEHNCGTGDQNSPDYISGYAYCPEAVRLESLVPEGELPPLQA